MTETTPTGAAGPRKEATMAPTALDHLAVNGALPFFATVEVRDEGRWVAEAHGSSVDWLYDQAVEAAAVYGQARIVSTYGTVLAIVSAPVEEPTVSGRWTWADCDCELCS
jgi:hypothetical protein